VIPISALGHKRTFWEVCATSALPPKADIVGRNGDVRFVPKADIKVYLLKPSFRRPTMLSRQFHECVQRIRNLGGVDSRNPLDQFTHIRIGRCYEITAIRRQDTTGLYAVDSDLGSSSGLGIRDEIVPGIAGRGP